MGGLRAIVLRAIYMHLPNESSLYGSFMKRNSAHLISSHLTPCPQTHQLHSYSPPPNFPRLRYPWTKRHSFTTSSSRLIQANASPPQGFSRGSARGLPNQAGSGIQRPRRSRGRTGCVRPAGLEARLESELYGNRLWVVNHLWW
jgi:hypothetical protein